LQDNTKVSGFLSSCFQQALWNSVRRLFALYGFKRKRLSTQLKPSPAGVTLKLHSSIHATSARFTLTSSKDYASWCDCDYYTPDYRALRHSLILAIQTFRHLTHYSLLFAPRVPLHRTGYVVHIHHCYYRLIRQSCSLPSDFLTLELYKGSSPYGMVLVDCKTFPALIMELSYHVAVYTPMNSTGAYGYFFPIGTSLHPRMTDSTSIHFHPSAIRMGEITTLQLSLYATTW